MSDIVERLRAYARNCGGPPEDYLTWQAADEIERLWAEIEQLQIANAKLALWKLDEIERRRMEQRHEAADTIEWLTEAHERIVEWARAYPLEVFPKPDLKRAHELLKAGGMTLDAVSADAMRHVIEQVAKISRAALESNP